MEHWEEKAEKLTGKIARMKNLKITFNPFSTNVPFMDKPGSWFLLAKCLKNTCGRVTFKQRCDLHLYLKCHSSTGVFQTFC